MNKKLLRKKLALMLATLKKKRPYYCEVEWIQTDNINSYVDTGIGGANNNLKFEMRFSTTSTQMFSAVFGNAREESENNWGIINGTGSNSFGYANSIRSSGANLLATWTKDGTPNDLVLWRENNNAYLTLNGTTVHASAPSGADNNSNIVFGRSGPTRVATQATYYTFYYFKIWDNGVLVRDYIPVLDWDMKPCMYDRVTEQLFYSAGTGDFVAGREIHYVDYIETTGTQYIDSGRYPWNTGKWELDIQYTYLGMIEGYNQVNGVYAHANQRFDIGCQYSNNSWNLNMGAIKAVGQLDLDRHTFVLDKINRTVYVDDIAYTGISVPTYTQQTSHAIWIGARYYYDGTQIYPCKEKIYGSRFWDNDGNLVRELCPAIDENGVGFLFDKANHTIHDNKGTGAFEYPAREVEYLESTGTQYIDTGVGKGSVSVIRTVADLSFNDLSTINAAGWGQSLAGGCFGFKENATYIYFNITGNDENSTLRYTAGKRLKFDLDGVNGKFTIYDGDSVAYTTTKKSSTSSNNNIGILFGFKNNYSINTKAQTIYSYKMYKNNAPVRDFIPCYKDGQAGMWDKVNSVFYQNAGAGDGFITGKIVEPKYE